MRRQQEDHQHGFIKLALTLVNRSPKATFLRDEATAPARTPALSTSTLTTRPHPTLEGMLELIGTVADLVSDTQEHYASPLAGAFGKLLTESPVLTTARAAYAKLEHDFRAFMANFQVRRVCQPASHHVPTTSHRSLCVVRWCSRKRTAWVCRRCFKCTAAWRSYTMR